MSKDEQVYLTIHIQRLKQVRKKSKTPENACKNFAKCYYNLNKRIVTGKQAKPKYIQDTLLAWVER